MTEMSALQKYEFKKKLEELRNYKGRATELISLYVPPTRQISDVVGYLRDEYSQSSNIKSKSTMKNVTGAIESLMVRLKYFKTPPENGMAMFVGHVAKGGDQTEMVNEVLEPPESVTTFVYRCDSSFYLEPLEEMTLDKKSYGLVVIDRNEATIGLLKGKRISVIKNFQSRIMGKHRQGGQSAQRFERLIEIAAHEYYKKVGDVANEAFMAEPELQGVLIGGPGSTKRFFAEHDYLHHELKKKLVDTFDTGYTDEYGLRELMENASNALSNLDVMREKRLVQKFMGEVKKIEGGLGAYGEEEVRSALLMGAVDTLLVSEGLQKKRLSLKCKDCGLAEERTVKEKSEEWKCPECEGQMEVESEMDMVDEYHKLAESVGTKVELISTESSEGEMLLKAFGGVAGILRFAISG